MSDDIRWPKIPPEALIYEGPIPEWVQKEINRICSERESLRSIERRENLKTVATFFIVSMMAVAVLVGTLWAVHADGWNDLAKRIDEKGVGQIQGYKWGKAQVYTPTTKGPL